MRKIIWINILMMLVLSCKDEKQQHPVSRDTVIANQKQPSDTIAGAIGDSSKSDVQNQTAEDAGITGVLTKMEKGVKLNTGDYEIVDGFLLQNKDESLSEGVGYSLFEYLKNKKANNEGYLAYLKRENSTDQEKVLGKLVAIMCIDLGEDNYSYDKLIKEFSIFKGSAAAEKAFNECMANHVQ